MIENVLVGVISGLFASIIFLFSTRRARHDVKVLDDIVLKDGVLVVKFVKFVNKSKAAISGVKVLMYGAKYQNDNKSFVSFCHLSEKTIPLVFGYDKQDKQLKFATLVGLPVSGKDFEQLKKEFHDVHVWIIGHDTYYGNHIAISKVYDLTKVKADHIFEIGDNLNTRSIQAV